jgi:hypothetical protein
MTKWPYNGSTVEGSSRPDMVWEFTMKEWLRFRQYLIEKIAMLCGSLRRYTGLMLPGDNFLGR